MMTNGLFLQVILQKKPSCPELYSVQGISSLFLTKLNYLTLVIIVKLYIVILIIVPIYFDTFIIKTKKQSVGNCMDHCCRELHTETHI